MTLKGIFALGSTDPHQADAEAGLRHLRKSLDEFQRLRMLNQLALRGVDKTCKFKADDMRVRLAEYRDPEMELRFRREMHTLLQHVYGREPSQEEMQAGPPGLGLVPLLLGVGAIVASSAWGLSSITGYLSDRERLARGAVSGPDWTTKFVTVIKGTLLVATIGGAGYGGYKLWKWMSARPKPELEPKIEIEEVAEETPELLEAAEEAAEE